MVLLFLENNYCHQLFIVHLQKSFELLKPLSYQKTEDLLTIQQIITNSNTTHYEKTRITID